MTSCSLVGIVQRCNTCGRVFTVTCPEQLQLGIKCSCGVDHYGAAKVESWTN